MHHPTEICGLRAATMLSLAFAASACTDDATDLPPAVGAWTSGQPAFRDATADWGLDALGAGGVRINITDIDGDGWPDLLSRKVGVGGDDFAAGQRSHWLLRNLGDTFADVTEASGLFTLRTDPGARRGRPGEVVACADVDNDGDVDIYTGVSTASPGAVDNETSEVMLNRGDGTFALGPEDSSLRRPFDVDAPAGASFTDVDLNGVVDLWVPQHNFTEPGTNETIFVQDHLYRGDGAGGFTDATGGAGLRTRDWITVADLNGARAHTRAWGAAACDLNGDGLPELLAPSYGRSPNHLWQASGAPGIIQYANHSIDSGYAFDDDLTWQDNQNALCFCRDNPSEEGCAGLPAPVMSCSSYYWSHSNDRQPFRLGGNSASTSCADIDNDGDMDLMTGEIKHWWAGSGADGSELLVNAGETDVRFERPGDAAVGLAVPHDDVTWDEGHMTQAIFDFDNDGWPDILQGASDYTDNRALLYHQTAPLAFAAVPLDDGIDHVRSHGAVVADFDRDGDLDVIIGHSTARCDGQCYESAHLRLFENVYGNGNRWIQLVLEGGPSSNRDAIGARVSVTGAEITQTQEVGGGFGHYGAQHDRVMHFGLGSASEARVVIRWPNGWLATQELSLEANHRYRIVQGESAEQL